MSQTPPEDGPARADRRDFAADVLHGLSQPQKSIPGKYLWDERGSQLFLQISDSPSYYPTRTELRLLRGATAEIARSAGEGCTVVDIGSGGSPKARMVLEALSRPAGYVAVDISTEIIEELAAKVRAAHPGLHVAARWADYSRDMAPIEVPAGSRVFGTFFGSSLGNMTPAEATRLLGRLRAALGPAILLLGCDPNQNEALLQAAYGGELMGAFHKNILARVNRELGSAIDPDNFVHEARVLRDPFRVEAHLVARRAASYEVCLETVHFSPGETIRTDLSHKYARPLFDATVREAGWTPVRSWDDADGLFSLHLLRGEV